MFNMAKDKFLGFRADEDVLEFVRAEAMNSNKTMSDWLRGNIKINKGK